MRDCRALASKSELTGQERYVGRRGKAVTQIHNRQLYQHFTVQSGAERPIGYKNKIKKLFRCCVSWTIIKIEDSQSSSEVRINHCLPWRGVSWRKRVCVFDVRRQRAMKDFTAHSSLCRERVKHTTKRALHLMKIYSFLFIA